MDRDVCRELANGLGAIKEAKQQNTPLAAMLAQRMYETQNSRIPLDLESWDSFARSALAAAASRDEPPELQLTLNNLLTSEVLAFLLRKWVRTLRAEAFGTEDAPFKTYAEVLQWARSEAKETSEIEGKKLGLQGSFSGLMLRAGWLSFPFDLGEPERGYYTILLKKDSEAHKLAQKISKGAAVMRLETLSLALFVLLDAKPLVLPYEMSLVKSAAAIPAEGGGFYEMQRNKVTVDIYSDMTFDEWRRLYGRFKKSFGTQRGKKIENHHLELYRLVEQRGFVPGKGVVAFWKGVQDEWNKKHKAPKYKTWKGVQLSYERMLRRVTTRLLLETRTKKRGAE
jgi:hypothetical protein